MIEMMWGPPLVVLASAALCATAKSSVGALLDARRELRQLHNEVQPPLVCVVVRTYWRHGPKYGDGLQRLIDTLRWQEHERCARLPGCRHGLRCYCHRHPWSIFGGREACTHFAYGSSWKSFSPLSVRCRWVAKLVVKDSTPFADLADILQAYNDPRISLYASWVRAHPSCMSAQLVAVLAQVCCS